MSKQKLMALASLSIVSFMAGCASDEGYTSSVSGLTEYRSRTDSLFIDDDTRIKSAAVNFKTYESAAEHIMRSDKSDRLWLAQNANLKVDSRYVNGTEIVTFVGNIDGAQVMEKFEDQVLVLAQRNKTIQGKTSEGETYRMTINESYRNETFRVDVYGHLNDVYFSERWQDGQLLNGNASFAIKILNGEYQKSNVRSTEVRKVPTRPVKTSGRKDVTDKVQSTPKVNGTSKGKVAQKGKTPQTVAHSNAPIIQLVVVEDRQYQ